MCRFCRSEEIYFFVNVIKNIPKDKPASSTTLDGSGSTGPVTSYRWSTVSGPNSPTITDSTAATTSVTGLVQGSYIFQLSVNNGSSTSRVRVDVLDLDSTTTIFTTQTPSGGTGNDERSIELGVVFRSSITGYVTGVRFYKTAGNTGTHIGELYDNNGIRLAQATFTGETSTGWQTVNFDRPVAITPGAAYIAAYFSSDGNYTSTLNYFGSELVNGPLTAFSERRGAGKKASAGLQILTVIFSGIYYFSLPAQYHSAALLRFELYAVALHLLIAFAPFTGRGEMNGFWQYNKTLFLRFLTTVLYAVVLYAGLSLALLAIEELFKVNIEGKYYGDLWILTACLFSTCFFLSGFPSEFEKLDAKTEYPAGLKIFTQYILLPIITIYLVILYAYTFKILFTMKWPFGWVSYLVLALSIAGILSLLLIHPERQRENNKWILIYSRFFYLALGPLIVLLFLAIERRIGDYGITEPRYFVLALALWLCVLVPYFLLSEKKNIKIIPVSLCFLAFLSSFGPWSAFSVSLRSQQKSLMRILEKNSMLYQGKFRPVKDEIQEKDALRINSIVEYMVNYHGYAALQPFFSQNLDSLIRSENDFNRMNRYTQANKIETLMNIQYSGSGFSSGNQHIFSFSTNGEGKIIPLTGYNFLVSADLGPRSFSEPDSFLLGKSTLLVSLEKNSNRILLQLEGGTVLPLDLFTLIHTFKNKSYTQFTNIDREELSLVAENKEMAVKVYFSAIRGNDDEKIHRIDELTADILIKIKE